MRAAFLIFSLVVLPKFSLFTTALAATIDQLPLIPFLHCPVMVKTEHLVCDILAVKSVSHCVRRGRSDNHPGGRTRLSMMPVQSRKRQGAKNRHSGPNDNGQDPFPTPFPPWVIVYLTIQTY